jgi:hypothetical protein
MQTWFMLRDITSVRKEIYLYGDALLALDAGPYFGVFVTICQWALAAQKFEEKHGVGSLLDLSHPPHVEACRWGESLLHT